MACPGGGRYPREVDLDHDREHHEKQADRDRQGYLCVRQPVQQIGDRGIEQADRRAGNNCQPDPERQVAFKYR